MRDIDLYAVGIVSASACALNEIPLSEVTEEINRRTHPGIGHGWQPAEEGTFSNGEPQPGPCNHFPDSRTHYLFHC